MHTHDENPASSRTKQAEHNGNKDHVQQQPKSSQSRCCSRSPFHHTFRPTFEIKLVVTYKASTGPYPAQPMMNAQTQMHFNYITSIFFNKQQRNSKSFYVSYAQPRFYSQMLTFVLQLSFSRAVFYCNICFMLPISSNFG